MSDDGLVDKGEVFGGLIMEIRDRDKGSVRVANSVTKSNKNRKKIENMKNR